MMDKKFSWIDLEVNIRKFNASPDKLDWLRSDYIIAYSIIRNAPGENTFELIKALNYIEKFNK